MIEKIKPLFFSFLATLILTDCSSLSLQRNSVDPAWVHNHPVSRTHFIGIGSAKIENDMYAAQMLARKRALQDITEQIQVSIVSDVHMSANYKTVNNTSSSAKTYQEEVAAFSQAVLAEWEEVRTFRASDGYYWSKVVLSRKKYYAQVNRKLTDAIEKICDIIRHAEEGTARFRIHELYKGFTIVDELFGTPLKVRIHGREVLLHNELLRGMSRLLESIEIKPTIRELKLSATEPVSQVPGVYVYCEGVRDRSLDIVWSASHPGVKVKAARPQPDGLYPVLINSLPASSGRVTITATPDLKNVSYDLIRRKFSLPSGSFTIRREKAHVYLGSVSPFCQSLAQLLADKSAITIVRNRNEAEYILHSDLTKSDNAVLSNSIFIADADLAIKLCSGNGMPVFVYNQTVQACDGISAIRALDNTQKYALEVAAKQVERVF